MQLQAARPRGPGTRLRYSVHCLPMSTDTLIHVALATLLVCWAVGAHNRLVRLKNAVGQAYERIDAELGQRQGLVEGLLQVPALREAGLLTGVEQALRVQRAAVEQLRLQPSAGAQVMAVEAAEQKLDEQLALLWQSPPAQQAVRVDPLLRQTVWELTQLDGRLEVVVEPYNLAVARFNQAAQEFPAWLIARLSSLRPLPGLHLGRHAAAREASRPLVVDRRQDDASTDTAA